LESPTATKKASPFHPCVCVCIGVSARNWREGEKMSGYTYPPILNKPQAVVRVLTQYGDSVREEMEVVLDEELKRRHGV